MTPEERFRQAVWTIHVCPVCAAQSPKHREPCLSDDPPGLRPLHVPYEVISAKHAR